MLHCCGYNKGIRLKLNVVLAVIKIIKYIGCFGIELISNIHVAAHGSYITDREGINPFAPEPPVTARADPCPFYPL